MVLYPTPNSTFKWLGGEEDSLEGMEVICLHSRVRRLGVVAGLVGELV